MIAEAAANPDGWVYEIVGEFSSRDAVPPSAIRGGWKVGPDGKLTGEYVANPNFQPGDPHDASKSNAPL